EDHLRTRELAEDVVGADGIERRHAVVQQDRDLHWGLLSRPSMPSRHSGSYDIDPTISATPARCPTVRLARTSSGRGSGRCSAASWLADRDAAFLTEALFPVWVTGQPVDGERVYAGGKRAHARERPRRNHRLEVALGVLGEGCPGLLARLQGLRVGHLAADLA